MIPHSEKRFDKFKLTCTLSLLYIRNISFQKNVEVVLNFIVTLLLLLWITLNPCCIINCLENKQKSIKIKDLSIIR